MPHYSKREQTAFRIAGVLLIVVVLAPSLIDAVREGDLGSFIFVGLLTVAGSVYAARMF